MRLLLVPLLVACADRSPPRDVVITALAGDHPAPGLTVVAHTYDGTPLARAITDADGNAPLVVNGDALISIVFPAVIDPNTSISVITTPAPVDELTVHVPPGPAPSPVIGTLTVDAPALASAEAFTIDLGCGSQTVTSLPATIDVAQCSLGTDTQLDVLVRGWHSVGDLGSELDGYAARRLPFTTGATSFSVPAWETATTNVPISVQGVVPSVVLTLVVDGIRFGTQDVTDHAELWNGLTVDASEVTAAIVSEQGWRTTTHTATGLPQAVTYTASDFLPVVTTNTTRGRLDPLAFDWQPASVGDALVLDAQWQNNAVGVRNPIMWNAVLPPDSATVTFPILDGALAVATSRPDPWNGNVILRYYDSDRYDGFDAVISDGLHVEDAASGLPVLVAPTSTPVRTADAYGCDCDYDHRRD